MISQTSAVWSSGDCPSEMESPHVFGKVKYLRCYLISRDSQSLRLCLKYQVFAWPLLLLCPAPPQSLTGFFSELSLNKSYAHKSLAQGWFLRECRLWQRIFMEAKTIKEKWYLILTRRSVTDIQYVHEFTLHSSLSLMFWWILNATIQKIADRMFTEL